MDHPLTFDPLTHTYRCDGRELLSVTTILRLAGMVNDTYFTPEIAERGTAVHDAIAQIAEGHDDREADDPVCAPYLDACRAFIRDTQVTLEVWERPVCDDGRTYAGTLDAIVSWPDKHLTLIDWKTGGFPPSTGPQTAAYLRCVRAWYPGLRVGRAGVHLRADGTYRYREFTNLVRDEADFLAAIRVAHFRREHHLDQPICLDA